ncbi:MAG: hypothetical protein M1816_003891, partial [Peltula sp. TS41687]
MIRRKVTALYEEEHMEKALQVLKKEKTLSIATVARRHGVPWETLRDRHVLGRQNYRQAHADQQKLTPFQEAYLVKWVKKLDDLGIPARRDLLQNQAQRILDRTGEPGATV